MLQLVDKKSRATLNNARAVALARLGISGFCLTAITSVRLKPFTLAIKQAVSIGIGLLIHESILQGLPRGRWAEEQFVPPPTGDS